MDRDHAAESAIRAWSRSDPQAAAVVQRVDRTRTRYLTQLLVREGGPQAIARVRADIATALVAGAQSMQHPVDRHRLQAMLDEHRPWILRLLAEHGGLTS